jgi:SAM-dependent methyltransferase
MLKIEYRISNMSQHPCTRNESNRHEWVAGALASLPPGGRILDAGAGQQPYRRHCAHLQYVSQDFGQYDPAENPDGLQMREWHYGGLDHECDIASIPEPNGSFDVILCTEVFEHLPNPLAAVREFARLLRPGGQLLLTAPFTSLTHFAPHHYATGFNRFFYETHLPAHGFFIEEITPNGNYFDVVAQEVRRVKSMAQRYVGRRPHVLERLATKVLLAMLRRLSQQGAASSELGCFGLHVRARRLATAGSSPLQRVSAA